jgi:hypothetical protein
MSLRSTVRVAGLAVALCWTPSSASRGAGIGDFNFQTSVAAVRGTVLPPAPPENDPTPQSVPIAGTGANIASIQFTPVAGMNNSAAPGTTTFVAFDSLRVINPQFLPVTTTNVSIAYTIRMKITNLSATPPVANSAIVQGRLGGSITVKASGTTCMSITNQFVGAPYSVRVGDLTFVITPTPMTFCSNTGENYLTAGVQTTVALDDAEKPPSSGATRDRPTGASKDPGP